MWCSLRLWVTRGCSYRAVSGVTARGHNCLSYAQKPSRMVWLGGACGSTDPGSGPGCCDTAAGTPVLLATAAGSPGAPLGGKEAFRDAGASSQHLTDGASTPPSNRPGRLGESCCSIAGVGVRHWDFRMRVRAPCDRPRAAATPLIGRHGHARRVRDPSRHHQRPRSSKRTARIAGQTRSACSVSCCWWRGGGCRCCGGYPIPTSRVRRRWPRRLPRSVGGVAACSAIGGFLAAGCQAAGVIDASSAPLAAVLGVRCGHWSACGLVGRSPTRWGMLL